MLKFNSQKAFSKMLRLEKKWGFDIMEHERNLTPNNVALTVERIEFHFADFKSLFYNFPTTVQTGDINVKTY